MLQATSAALPADRQWGCEEMVLESYYYTCRNITDAELAAYIGFYETDLEQTTVIALAQAETQKKWRSSRRFEGGELVDLEDFGAPACDALRSQLKGTIYHYQGEI